jgi:hypothetical protein
MQSPSTLDILLSNGLHELDNLSTRAELSSDHLPVLFEVTSDSRREVPNHYIFNYKHADWNQFNLILDSRIDLDFSLERIQNSSQIDSVVESFTTALLEALTTAVPKTVPFRYSLVLTPEMKALIARKNTLRRIAQRTKNSGDKRNYEALNSIVKDVCQELQNKNFCEKLSTIQPNHKSLFDFKKLIKNKSRGVPALKVDEVTLLT